MNVHHSLVIIQPRASTLLAAMCASVALVGPALVVKQVNLYSTSCIGLVHFEGFSQNYLPYTLIMIGMGEFGGGQVNIKCKTYESHVTDDRHR